jgi:hypothetical protein
MRRSAARLKHAVISQIDQRHLRAGRIAGKKAHVKHAVASAGASFAKFVYQGPALKIPDSVVDPRILPRKLDRPVYFIRTFWRLITLNVRHLDHVCTPHQHADRDVARIAVEGRAR